MWKNWATLIYITQQIYLPCNIIIFNATFQFRIRSLRLLLALTVAWKRARKQSHCRKRWILGSNISHSYQYTFHTTLILLLIYTFNCILGAIWPTLCCCAKPIKQHIESIIHVYAVLPSASDLCNIHVIKYKVKMRWDLDDLGTKSRDPEALWLTGVAFASYLCTLK